MTALLQVEDLRVAYGKIEAVKGISFTVEAGQVVTLIGTNGAGKTTTLRTLSGLLKPIGGQILFEGKPLTNVPAQKIVSLGLAHAPEGRHIFPRLTITENLLLGAYRPEARADIAANLDFSFEAFPVLAQRRRQLAGSMSGGEQQMLAVARALMSSPRILLVDELSVGLAPILVSRVIGKIKELKERRQLTVLMAEQNFNQAVRIADRGYVIVHGKIAFEGESAEALNNNELIREFYLGA